MLDLIDVKFASETKNIHFDLSHNYYTPMCVQHMLDLCVECFIGTCSSPIAYMYDITDAYSKEKKKNKEKNTLVTQSCVRLDG